MRLCYTNLTIENTLFIDKFHSLGFYLDSNTIYKYVTKMRELIIRHCISIVYNFQYWSSIKHPELKKHKHERDYLIIKRLSI